MGSKQAGDPLRCSFCHKSQDVVGKLICSPSEYRRAYICDECIAVCNSILEDDRRGAMGNQGLEAQPNRDFHHPIYELLDELTPEQLDALSNLLMVLWKPKHRNITAMSGGSPASANPGL